MVDLMNLENTASFVASRMGQGEVDWISGKYGAASLEDLSASDYEEVYSELFQQEADLIADERD